MSYLSADQRYNIENAVYKAISETKITDIHTHVYDPAFGELLLWGIDDLLTYHYLVSEAFRWMDISYDDFWGLPKQYQADMVWKALFIDHSPVSESCRGVLAVLDALGLDVSMRDLDSYREYFESLQPSEYIDKVFEIANLDSVVMTNDPFDDLERPVWLAGFERDPRFHAALRMDALLNSWETAAPKLKQWGYDVSVDFSGETCAEVRRFLTEWIDRIDALYMAVSLPPSFAYPEESPRGRLFAECVLPVARETNLALGLMIGVKRQVNPDLKLAGDAFGKSDISVIECLCRENQDIRFIVTMLARDNQQELIVASRKFRNLHVFGCWWYLNSPFFIEELTRMRMEWLGLSFTPQHSDARVLDQVIYKWGHSLPIIADVLIDKYANLAATGWQISEEEIKRDITGLLGGNFWQFIS
ncbi:MAG: glucuronate isomerase [Armatimonadetes bacterium]|nr:glucuronate isomerase [Armatimonadota bacterium]